MVEIMQANNHYYNPKVDGCDAIVRQLKMGNGVILVAERGNAIAGFVLGTWDGARAFIHKMSVHPDFQRLGIGTALVKGAAAGFRSMGASTIGVSAADDVTGEHHNSVGFWEKQGFESIPARVMIHFEIGRLLEGER
jgi:ribosomal protein S18 acetylase RimI-like enzyme